MQLLARSSSLFQSRILIIAICLSSLFIAHKTKASDLVHSLGGIGGSGGEFIKDQLNPWFVKNTNEVNYCIKIDSNGFSADPIKIQSLIKKSLDYWKDEFQTSRSLLGIARQTFIENKGCQGNEGLVFQFGYNTLTEEQIEIFDSAKEDVHDYLGIALRTNYDKVNMRGSGFIYISSDKGDHMYNKGKNVAKELWRHDGLLYRMLLHELGHVFGVAHTPNTFMASDFPEYMIRNYNKFISASTHEYFFRPTSLYLKCPWSRTSSLNDKDCIKIETKDDWKTFTVTDSETSSTAVTKMDKSSLWLFPVSVFMPDEQKVFDNFSEELVWKDSPIIHRKLFAEIKYAKKPSAKNQIKSYIFLELMPGKIDLYFSPE